MKIDIAVIHGFSNQLSEERFGPLIKRIGKELPLAHIIPVNYFDEYPPKEIRTKIFGGRKGLEEMAEICLKIIEGNRKHAKLIIIGTSLGALMARVLVEKFGVLASAVILAGIPNGGVNLKPREKFGLIFSKKKWIKEVRKGSKFLNAMNEELKARNLSTKYYLLAGIKDKQVSKESVLALKSFMHIEAEYVADVSHYEIIPQPKSDPGASSKVFDLIMKWIKEAAK